MKKGKLRMRDRVRKKRRKSDGTIPAPQTSESTFGLQDSRWSPDDWAELLRSLVGTGMCTWREVAGLVLGHLNPSQVGTSLASSEGFKRRYGKGNTMRIVMRWAYDQTGKCADCGTRLELQADHIKGKEEFPRDPHGADFIENMTLRCRRCNVIRRPSHEYGGLTFLTAEAALMWILLVIRPRTLLDYIRMCRLYGMTMSDIRMQEAWAMAHWLAGASPPLYRVENDDRSSYDLVLWPDSAVTRVDPRTRLPDGATRIYRNIPGSASLAFIAIHPDGRAKYHEQAIGFLPFSTYDLGDRPPQALCLRYTAPGREEGVPQKIPDLPPRGTKLVAHAIRREGQEVYLASSPGAAGPHREALTGAPAYGRILRTRISLADCRLVVE